MRKQLVDSWILVSIILMLGAYFIGGKQIIASPVTIALLAPTERVSSLWPSNTRATSPRQLWAKRTIVSRQCVLVILFI